MTWKHYVVSAFGLAVACAGTWLPVTPYYTMPMAYLTIIVGFGIIGFMLRPSLPLRNPRKEGLR